MRDKVEGRTGRYFFSQGPNRLFGAVQQEELFTYQSCARGFLGEHRRHCQDSRQDHWCHTPRQRHRQKPPRGKSDCRWTEQRPAYPRQDYLLQVQRGDDEGQALYEQDRRHKDLPRLLVARPTCQMIGAAL